MDETLIHGEHTKVYYDQYAFLIEDLISKQLNINLEEARVLATKYWGTEDGAGEKFFDDYKIDINHWHNGIIRFDISTITPLPHVMKLIEQLKKEYLIGLVSDCPLIQAQRVLSASKIDKEIFDIFIAWETGKMPPKNGLSNIYKYISEKFELLPEEILMVGDSLRTDIIPAFKYGINVVHVSKKDTGQFPTIPSILELHNYLKRNFS